MWYLADRPIYRVVLTVLYVLNVSLLCGIAYLVNDPRLDWHEWCYPAFIGAGMLVGAELGLYRWNARRKKPDRIESDRWIWIITIVLLIAAAAAWIWTFNNRRDELADLQRQQSAPPTARFEPNVLQNFQKLQQLRQASQP